MNQHPRYIVGDYSETDGVVWTIRKTGGREIDRVADGTGFEEIADGFCSHGSGGIFSFFSGGSEVRQEDSGGVIPK